VTLALNKCVTCNQPFLIKDERCSFIAICKEIFVGGVLKLLSNLKQVFI
jgi:hypothetical protein